MKGKVLLAKYKNSKILVNIDFLIEHGGSKLSNKIQEVSWGKFLNLLTIALIVIPISILILNGEFNFGDLISPTGILYFLPYLSIYTLIFSLFLKRNRDSFDESIRYKNLQKYNKQALSGDEIDLFVDDFIDFETLCILDKSLNDNSRAFIASLCRQLFADSDIEKLLSSRLGVNIDKLLEYINQNSNNINFTFPNSHRTLFLYLFDDAVKLQSNSINKYILFFVLNKYFLKSIFLQLGISELELEGLKIWFKNETKQREYYAKWEKLSKFKPRGNINRAYTSRPTPVLDEYAEDFTNQAAFGLFMLSAGKDEEMTKVIEIMERDKARGCLILGDPGVGKTRFLRHLATRMVVEDIPGRLYDHRLLTIDLNKILTKVGNVDVFKQTLQKIFEEVRYSGTVVLVLEEFSQVLNIREDSRMEVINLISNSINNLNLRLIATTTPSSYSKYIKPIKALSSAFDVVQLKEPSPNLALQILIDEVPRIERKYKVSVRINSLKRIVEFAPKFEQDRVMPDKGIDLLEESCLIAKNKGLAFLDVSTIDEILSEKVGVKVGNLSESESSTLMNLATRMHERVIGQSEAIDSITSAIKRARSGLTNSKKPIASFLFYGPSGVGKTEVAKTLADVYYGNENLLIRLDMSEFQETDNLNRIIGYTDEKGNFNGGYLTEAVRLRPFSLVLLDEVEKANKKVLDLFLQVLDEGSITDGLGRKVDFTNTIIIMTSNVGSELIAKKILEGTKYNQVEKEVSEKLREFFRVEFLNRFDKLIMFKPLTKIEVEQVVLLVLKKINDNLMQKGISISWNEQTLVELADLGYSEMFGARELRRIIQENIENKLADLIIQGHLRSGTEAVFNGLSVQQVLN